MTINMIKNAGLIIIYIKFAGKNICCVIIKSKMNMVYQILNGHKAISCIDSKFWDCMPYYLEEKRSLATSKPDYNLIIISQIELIKYSSDITKIILYLKITKKQ